MGTRGAFGVVIGEVEKIGYNQYDSYVDGKGIENLQWLRMVVDEGELGEVKQAAIDCKLVSDEAKPTPKDVKALKPFTNLGVSEQSTDDWYCLTRDTHGSIQQMLACGYILDYSTFPLDSLFCEWAYIVDFDRGVFEVYQGFQKELPTAGRWAGRPTPEEDEKNYAEHLKWCAKNKRDPWMPEVSEFKAVQIVASYSFDSLPADDWFLGYFALGEARRELAEYPDGMPELLSKIENEGLADPGRPYASEWERIAASLRLKLEGVQA